MNRINDLIQAVRQNKEAASSLNAALCKKPANDDFTEKRTNLKHIGVLGLIGLMLQKLIS